MLAQFPEGWGTIEYVTEHATQIIACRVERVLEEKYIAGDFAWQFTYVVSILDIYLDLHGRMRVDDVAEVVMHEGMMTAKKAWRIMCEEDNPILPPLFTPELYGDGDWVTSTYYDAIPVEVGKTYLMFLNDGILEKTGCYNEIGDAFLYEYEGDTVYVGANMRKSESTTAQIIEMIKDQIEKRPNGGGEGA